MPKQNLSSLEKLRSFKKTVQQLSGLAVERKHHSKLLFLIMFLIGHNLKSFKAYQKTKNKIVLQGIFTSSSGCETMVLY